MTLVTKKEIEAGKKLIEKSIPGPWTTSYGVIFGDIDNENHDGDFPPIVKKLDLGDSPECRFIAHHNPKHMTRIYETMNRMREVIEYYSGNFNGKEGTKWNSEIFYYEDKIGGTCATDGGKCAIDLLKEIGE